MKSFAVIALLRVAADAGVVIQKPKEVTKSMQAADAIKDYRKTEEKKAKILDFAKNTVDAAPGARHKQYQEVLKAQGKAVAASKAAAKKTEAAMKDVEVSGDLPTKKPPKVPKDLKTQADDLATKMGSGALGCECSAQLYGDAAKGAALLVKDHKTRHGKMG